jgi:uroporphyrinogen-III synthase
VTVCAGSVCDGIGRLQGYAIGVTADRRSEEQAELLRRQGADVLQGPTIRTLPWADEGAIAAATAQVIARRPAYVVANTAIGMRSWLAFAESRGLDAALLDALGGATIVARGPKAAGAVTQLGFSVRRQAETEQLADLLRSVAPEVAGRVVAVQLSGNDLPEAMAALADTRARVIEVPVYRWLLPDDTEPAKRLLAACLDGRLAAVTLTSPPAVDHLFAIAAGVGQADALRAVLNGPVVCACVGPVTARTARANGVDDPLHPARGRLGLMVRCLGEVLHARHRHLDLSGRQVVVQGAAVCSDGVQVTLTDRERAVFGLLARRPGAVVPKPLLLREIWGVHSDPHVVDITVGRLRRRLEPTGLSIGVAPRRGYRLDVFRAGYDAPTG